MLKKIVKAFQNTKFQLLTIVLLTFLAYSNIFTNEFVLDDETFITQWKTVQNSNIREVLGFGLQPDGRAIFRPLSKVILWIYYHLWGSNVFWYHFTAIFFHILATILIYFITRELVHSSWLVVRGKKKSANHQLPVSISERTMNYIPFITALLFGLHPIHTEAVDYILASTGGLPSTVFLFAAFYFYIKLKFKTALVFFLLALFSYEATLILVPLIILYDLFFENSHLINESLPAASLRLRGRSDSRTSGVSLKRWKAFWFKNKIKRYVPFFLAVFIFLVVRLFFLSSNNLKMELLSPDKMFYMQIFMTKIYLMYIWLLVSPFKLSINHILPGGFETSVLIDRSRVIKQIFDLWTVISLASIASLVGLGFFLRKKFKLISFGIFWFFISILPFSNLIPTGAFMEERYIYIASFGFCLILAWCLAEGLWYSRTIGRIGLIGMVFLCFLLLTFYFYRTYQRNKDWQNRYTIWSSVISAYPGSFAGNYKLGGKYVNGGYYKESIPFLLKAVELDPSSPDARTKLGFAYQNLKMNDKAIAEYNLALNSNPDLYTLAFVSQNSAKIYLQQDATDKALTALRQPELEAIDAKNSKPDLKLAMSQIYNTLGYIYMKKNNPTISFLSFDQSNEFNPENMDALNNKEKLFKTFGDLNNWQEYNLNGVDFKYPSEWTIKKTGRKIKVSSPGDIYVFELEADFKEKGMSFQEYLYSQKISSDKEVKQGFINIKSWDQSFIREWKMGNSYQAQLFLLKGDRVLKILIKPSDQIAKRILTETLQIK